MKTRSVLGLQVLALCLLTAVLALLGHANSLQDKRREPWQIDWKAYVAEISKHLEKGVDPSEAPSFQGKQVEFEGLLRKAFNPEKPDAALDVEMEPREVTVALKLFPGISTEKAGDKTGTVTVKKVLVKPATSNRDAWKVFELGAKVRFRATIGTDAVTLVTTSDLGGLIFLFLGRVTRCEPPHLLSFTWGEELGDESEVTFELADREGQVLMVLTHRRLRNRTEMVRVASGWHVHAGILIDLLSGREPKPFWSTHERLEAEYDKRLPAEDRAASTS